MRVTFVTTEAVPFAKTGGLADVSGALPKALVDAGVETNVILPLYGTIDPDQFGLTKLIVPHTMLIPVGPNTEGLGIWWGSLPDSPVQVYFLEHSWFFNRPSLYTDPATGWDYDDNAARFVYFCRAALAAVEALDLRPDVIHCNDYQTALIPSYLRLVYNDNPAFQNIASVYSIHNMAYQGRYPRSTMAVMGLGYELFYPESPFEYYEQVNFMKAGIVYADMLNTVSEQYAQEIQGSAEYGHGLESVLSNRSDDLRGIVNGIDYDIWNPATDPLIPAHFTPDSLAGKQANKQALREAFSLPLLSDDTPIVGMVSRLVSQKGFDLVSACIDTLAGMDLQLVILGTGSPEYHTALEQAAWRHPDRISVRLTFDNRLAHLIEAGSDIFLMPSQYEPCGLNQLYSLRYGTLPVVRGTGGLVDTIRNYDPATGDGTGFIFWHYTSEAMTETLGWALEVYHDRPVWETMMRRAMQEDFSWQASAKKYAMLYERAVEKRRGG